MVHFPIQVLQLPTWACQPCSPKWVGGQVRQMGVDRREVAFVADAIAIGFVAIGAIAADASASAAFATDASVIGSEVFIT